MANNASQDIPMVDADDFKSSEVLTSVAPVQPVPSISAKQPSYLSSIIPKFSSHTPLIILISISAIYLTISRIMYGVHKKEKSDQKKIDDMKTLRKSAIITQLGILLIFIILCMIIALFNQKTENVISVCVGLIFISIYISMFWIYGIVGWDVNYDFM